jgi:hypothetical protein
MGPNRKPKSATTRGSEQCVVHERAGEQLCVAFKWGGLIVQAIAIASALALCLSAFTPARAQQTNDCKSCREYQQACLKNHTRDACNNEYSICMKYCKKK